MVFIVGTAGSGKSYLTAALSDWLEDNELSVTRVNLDPAAEWIPYPPDVDVREYVDARKIMVERGLGPNGALLVSIDLLVSYIEELKSEILDFKSNYVLIDTPGQLELYAFRQSGPLVGQLLAKGMKAVTLFLIDSFFATEISNFISALLLSASVNVRFKMPQLNVLSKSDLLPSKIIDAIHEWLENPHSIPEVFEERAEPTLRLLSQRLIDVLTETQLILEPIPVSSKTGEGLDTLYANMQRLLAGGEDYLTEEPSGKL